MFSLAVCVIGTCVCLGIQSVFVFYLYIFFDQCGARVRWTRTLEEAGEEEEEEEEQEEEQ